MLSPFRSLSAKVIALIWLALFFNFHESVAQSWPRRYVNSLVNDTSDISLPQLLIYPTLAYTPETSWEFGFSSLFVYYANRDTTNRLSEISGFTFLTLERQYGIFFDHALYSNQNKWFVLGKIKLQSFPLKYFGIGMGTSPGYQALVDANQIVIKERLLRKLRKNLYFGLEVEYQRLSQVQFKPGPEVDALELPLGYEGSSDLAIGLGLLYDSRHNVLNVRHGFFSELAVERYLPEFSTFAFTSVLFDTRIYREVAPNTVLAGQVYGFFNFGDIPFNQLALLGGESLMRGYYLGRFRDNHLSAAQAEIRFLPLPLGFSKRIGAAAFAGAGQVFNDFGRVTGKDLVWSAGGGLRFLLFPKKDIYTRFDIAFTSEGTGYYLFIGEAF